MVCVFAKSAGPENHLLLLSQHGGSIVCYPLFDGALGQEGNAAIGHAIASLEPYSISPPRNGGLLGQGTLQ